MSYPENPLRILIAGKEPGYSRELKLLFATLGIHALTLPRQLKLGDRYHIQRLAQFAKRANIKAAITGKRNVNLENGYDDSGWLLADELKSAGIPVLMLSVESHRVEATRLGYAFVRTGADIVTITDALRELLKVSKTR
jgi:hypothetical protein